MIELPRFRFSDAGLARDDAFEAWRQIMARMFDIDRSASVEDPPRGALSAILLDDVMLNRSRFSAQHLTRDRRRIAATPDHLVLQLYRAGGFAGVMNDTPVSIGRGQIAICDLRHGLDVHAMRSDTIGLTIPRALLAARDLDRLPPRLDPARERLLAAHIRSIHHRLPRLSQPAALAQKAEVLAFLRRLFDPAVDADALDAPAFDADNLALAEDFIATALASPDLSPAVIAARLQLSRATLYRIFEPVGGVMQRVWQLRLEAVRAALDAPTDTRTLSRLALDHGFRTAAHLSRSFRARYGTTPRDWRRQAAATGGVWQAELDRLNASWRDLAP